MRINFASHQKQSAGTGHSPWLLWLGSACFAAAIMAGPLLTAEEPAPKPAAPNQPPPSGSHCLTAKR